MTYLLIIFLYLEGHVIEAEMDSLADCRHYEALAHARFENITTQCVPIKNTAPEEGDSRRGAR